MRAASGSAQCTAARQRVLKAYRIHRYILPSAPLTHSQGIKAALRHAGKHMSPPTLCFFPFAQPVPAIHREANDYRCITYCNIIILKIDRDIYREILGYARCNDASLDNTYYCSFFHLPICPYCVFAVRPTAGHLFPYGVQTATRNAFIPKNPFAYALSPTPVHGYIQKYVYVILTRALAYRRNSAPSNQERVLFGANIH